VPAAASGTPVVSSPAAAAIAAPAVPAVAAPAAPSAQRRDRRKLRLGDKIHHITEVADRVPDETLALRYGVTKRAIYGVWAGWSKILDAAARGVPLRAHCVQVCWFPLIGELLYEWFMRIRSMGRKTMPISRIALQVKASQLACLHYPVTTFSASNGFVDRWVKRRSLGSVHLHGSGGGIDLLEGEWRTAELREKMVALDPECILNMDETALLYKLAPTYSYVLECDSKETHGTELQRAEARVTLVICVNATGTFKSIAVIGKASQSVCFRGQTDLHVRYYSQKKGWMDSTVCAKWLADLREDWGAFNSRRGSSSWTTRRGTMRRRQMTASTLIGCRRIRRHDSSPATKA